MIMAENKRISRRKFLRGAGATLVLVAGGGVYRAVDQGVFSAAMGPAYEPWTTWRMDLTEGPLALVRAGILAANPHNSQPWLFRVTDTQITLYADIVRNLGTMDPYLREMHIGLGCALENMLLAAQAYGYTADLTLEPGTLAEHGTAAEPVPVATLELASTSPQALPLYEAIPNRHTDRYAYDATRTVAPETVQALQQLIDTPDTRFFLFTRGESMFQRFVDETIAATEWIIADEVMSHDSHAWFPTSWEEVQREKDGPYIDTAGVSPAIRALSKIARPLLPQSTLDNGWLSGTRTSLPTSAVLGFIAVRDMYDKQQTLQAGRVWQRTHLWATTQGLAMQPINQLPEVVDRERQLGQTPRMAQIIDQLTGDASWRPTFAFRLGYPTTTPLPSARRPVEDVVL